jgi:hypothetical protein
MNRLVLACAFVASFILLNQQCSASNEVTECTAAANQQGLRLANDLRQRYPDLRRMKPDSASLVATQLVEKYITFGTPFKCAEEILLAAGFKLNRDPTQFPAREGVRHGFVAGLLRIDSTAFTATYLSVNLFGETEDRFDLVQKLSVNLHTDTP